MESSLNIRKLLGLHYYVRDLERSRRFYTEKLDFRDIEALYREPFHGGGHLSDSAPEGGLQAGQRPAMVRRAQGLRPRALVAREETEVTGNHRKDTARCVLATSTTPTANT